MTCALFEAHRKTIRYYYKPALV